MLPHVVLLAALAGPASEPPPLPLPAPRPSWDPSEEEAPAADPGPAWEGSVNLGLTFTEGNSRVRSVSAGMDAKREVERDTWKLRSWWNLQEQDGVTSQSDAGATLDYNYNATERLYYLATFGLDHDDQASLSLRWWAGAGAGYRFLTQEPTKLSADAALTYFDESFQGAGPDGGHLAARGAYDLSHRISKTTKFAQIGEIFPSLEDKDDVYAKLDTKLRMDITDTFFSQIQYIFGWDNTPAPGNRRDDHKLVVGLGWSFGG